MATIDLTPGTLEARARRAYERGRWTHALKLGLLALPLLCLSGIVPCQTNLLWVTAPLLFAALVGFSVRGGEFSAALLPGLLAGLVPFTLPVATRLIGHLCESSLCMTICMPACCAGGLFAGASIGLLARAEERPLRFLLAATLLSVLTGAMGCSVAGITGIVGMLAATAITSVPMWLRSRA
ncbi:MAG: hypothetical protein JST92_11435 [Deltaproteobacteria bacterium]|nr:hypothetical protein [Deltaproteobacteria bacterium]